MEQLIASREASYITEQIRQLKEERKAVILAHNYQRPEVLDVADIQGDSLELSRAAAKTKAEVIAFCGVHFMAETASILCPDKRVLLPEIESGCPLADQITVAQLRAMRARYPEAAVVCYVNSSAEVKAESDICCTSANATRVVNSLNGVKQVLLIPDKHLAQYVARHTDKQVIFWEGNCPAHHNLQPEEVLRMKALYPEAKFMAHPECTPEVLALADCVTSTSGMLRYVEESEAEEFVVGTEEGMAYVLQRAFPMKRFYHFPGSMVCHDMKRITLVSIINALEKMQYVITVEDEIRRQAMDCLSRMMKVV
jgi:quinolinate synthase